MASVATTPLWTVEEYLRTTFRPDVDLVDGRIEGRNSGEWNHAAVVFRLATLLNLHRQAWRTRTGLEVRVQTSRYRFRVPDVCLTDARHPKEQVIRRAPLLCIEVLSPEDTLARLWKRSDDYFRMGVPEVWIFDPSTRTVHVRRDGRETIYTRGPVTLTGTQIAIDIDEVFAALDEE